MNKAISFADIQAGQVGHVYVLRLKSDPCLFKIGRSALGKLEARFRRLRVGSLLSVVFVGTFFPYREWERAAHLDNRDTRLPQSEYFRLTGARLEDLLFALESGNLAEEVANNPTPCLITCDESSLVVHQENYDPLVVDYQSVESFASALATIQEKIQLDARQAFLRANARLR